MKGKGNIGDPYLADFTQKIINNKRSNEEVLESERRDAEDEIRKRLSKNPQAMEKELENLDINHELKKVWGLIIHLGAGAVHIRLKRDNLSMTMIQFIFTKIECCKNAKLISCKNMLVHHVFLIITHSTFFMLSELSVNALF